MMTMIMVMMVAVVMVTFPSVLGRGLPYGSRSSSL